MDDLIVKMISRIVIPFMIVYGIYIILFGHISPGGGFSGGAILGAAMVLYTLSFSADVAMRKFPHSLSMKLESGGIWLYIFIGLIGIFTADSFLSNQQGGFYIGNAGDLISAGMIPILTVGIGIKVASTMITLFHTIIEEEGHE
jgi:multicomponent Na+:H+ antiporter subunit B